jgi:hypothetical protein
VADVIDRRIAGIAFKQHGNITRQQLLGLGMSPCGIARRVQIGMLYPVFGGVCAVGCPPQTPLQRAAAAVLDIAARRNQRQYQRDVDNALHSNYLTTDAIVDLLDRHPRHPATGRLAWFVTTEGGPTQSDWERQLPAFCVAQRLPEPVMAPRAAGHTPDAGWPQHVVVLELDGWRYHNPRFDFETDHDRDLDYLADDLIPARITWELMMHVPDRTGERLRRFVARRSRYRPAG